MIIVDVNLFYQNQTIAKRVINCNIKLIKQLKNTLL